MILSFVFVCVLATSAQNSTPAMADPAAPVEPSSLPNTPSAKTPLTPRQKFGIFVKSTYSPYTFATAAFDASWAQAFGDWYDYGGGMSGWGKRYGASLADSEGKIFFSSFLLPVILHQDPRYFRSPRKGFGPRAWYAVTRVVITRADDGRSEFNYSEVGGSLLTTALQNAYYPDTDRGFGDTLVRFGGDLSSEATSNLLREFSPEIKRLARKIVPKRVQKVEDKLPKPVRQLGGSSD